MIFITTIEDGKINPEDGFTKDQNIKEYEDEWEGYSKKTKYIFKSKNLLIRTSVIDNMHWVIISMDKS